MKALARKINKAYQDIYGFKEENEDIQTWIAEQIQDYITRAES